MKVLVNVTLKKSISDPQGIAVRNALNSLNYSEVKDARIGRIIELTIDDEKTEGIKERVKEMCEKLLANTVIEHYSFEILEG